MLTTVSEHPDSCHSIAVPDVSLKFVLQVAIDSKRGQEYRVREGECPTPYCMV